MELALRCTANSSLPAARIRPCGCTARRDGCSSLFHRSTVRRGRRSLRGARRQYPMHPTGTVPALAPRGVAKQGASRLQGYLGQPHDLLPLCPHHHCADIVHGTCQQQNDVQGAWSRFTPFLEPGASLPSRYRSGTDQVPIRYRSGTDQVPIRYRSGTDQVPSRIRARPDRANSAKSSADPAFSRAAIYCLRIRGPGPRHRRHRVLYRGLRHLRDGAEPAQSERCAVFFRVLKYSACTGREPAWRLGFLQVLKFHFKLIF